MSTQDIILLVIGISLILGAFVSAWVFFKVIKGIEEQKKKPKK